MVVETVFEKTQSYSYRTVLCNTLQCLVPCKLRELNGAYFLHYATDGMLSIEELYGNGGMKGEEVRRLFSDLQIAKEEMTQYLLEPEELFLGLKGIYRRTQDGKFRFCFGSSEGETTGVLHLIEQLEPLLDETEDALKKTLIQAQQILKKEGGSMEQIIQLIKKENQSTDHVVGEPIGQKEISEVLFLENGLHDSELICEEDWEEDIAAFSQKQMEAEWGPIREEYGSIEDEESPTEKKKYRGTILLAVCLCSTAIGAWVLPRFFILSPREKILIAAVPMVFFVLTVISLLRGRRSQKKKDDPVEEVKQNSREDIFADAIFEKNARTYSPLTNMGKTGSIAIGESGTKENADRTETQQEKTAMLAEEKHQWAHKLYSRREEPVIKIDLSRLPLTIGKVPGIADVLLKRDEISRLHVQFFQKQGDKRLFMRDLHSTNGTFRNGRRLEGGEAVALLSGDEIHIGPIEFEYV